MKRFRCSIKEISERQLLIRSRDSATFYATDKALVGCKKSIRWQHAARGPYVVQACSSVPV